MGQVETVYLTFRERCLWLEALRQILPNDTHELNSEPVRVAPL
jgi:hypothetical protein